MKYFKMSEFTKTRVNADNTPSAEHEMNLRNLVEKILDPLRGAYGKPIHVNSGYRSKAVNEGLKQLGFKVAANSQHMNGEAADITAGNPAENRKLFEMIRNGGYTFDQLIDEEDYKWLHVSLKRTGSNRMQVLHLK